MEWQDFAGLRLQVLLEGIVRIHLGVGRWFNNDSDLSGSIEDGGYMPSGPSDIAVRSKAGRYHVCLIWQLILDGSSEKG
jgi:hypothetical protein